MSDKPVFLYVAAYNSESDAEADYQAVKVLYQNGAIATYDAAVITKDGTGKVRVTKHEKPTQHGAWTGAAIGAVVGLIFPPSIVVGAAVGAGVGALTGHLAKGVSRSDMDRIGNLLQNNRAALFVLGESRLQQELQQAVTHAVNQYETQVQIDSKEFDQDLAQIANDLSSTDTTGSSPNA
jgi:uncharacterized membrane protein